MIAPYRITRKDPRLRRVSASREQPDQEIREYLSRLIKLIPSEVVGLYLGGSGVIPQDQQVPLIVWSLFCLLCVVLSRVYGSSKSGWRDPQWKVVWISIISFLIWIYSLGGVFRALGIYVPYVGTLLILAWTFLVPFLYKGEIENQVAS
jgi:hypothetical protein